MRDGQGGFERDLPPSKKLLNRVERGSPDGEEGQQRQERKPWRRF